MSELLSEAIKPLEWKHSLCYNPAASSFVKWNQVISYLRVDAKLGKNRVCDVGGRVEKLLCTVKL